LMAKNEIELETQSLTIAIFIARSAQHK
jgi:hypothetical protein